ncbi:FIST N-terminal domain-containing protein [Candidatus Altiarchaeota archaeon]
MTQGEITQKIKPEIKEEPSPPDQKPEFTAAVGLSRLWDAYEAGREVAQDLLKQMGDKEPDVVLLFSTIHYKHHGGFKKLLKGIHEILPKKTRLIGGTVTGFIIQQGCFTRGVTLQGIYYSDMDFSIAVGHNTKRNPKKAANDCIKQIKGELSESKYHNLFIYEIISGTKIPEIPGMGIKRVIKSEKIAALFNLMSDFSLKILQKGVGREDEILPLLVEAFPDAYLIGGSSFDDYNLIENYQFVDNTLLTNALILLAIKSNLTQSVNTTYGLQETNKTFVVTKTTGHGRTITEIDNKPANKGWLDAMDWPEDVLDEKIHRKTFYCPVGFIHKGILHPNVPAFFWGKSILCGYNVKEPNHRVFIASGRSLIDSVEENMIKIKNKNNLAVFIVSCAVRLGGLGSKIFNVREKIIDSIGDTPFVCIYVTGEDTYSPEVGERHVNESFNVASLYY